MESWSENEEVISKTSKCEPLNLSLCRFVFLGSWALIAPLPIIGALPMLAYILPCWSVLARGLLVETGGIQHYPQTPFHRLKPEFAPRPLNNQSFCHCCIRPTDLVFDTSGSTFTITPHSLSRKRIDSLNPALA